MSGASLVTARDLVKVYPVRRGIWKRRVGEIRAVDGVSFSIHRGETLALVGETGSGKSTIGRMLLRLVEPTSGAVFFDGADVFSLDQEALRALRRRMQVIFQDSRSSLDPRMSVGRIVAEPLDIHRIGTPSERADRVAELLRRVGLDPSTARRRPGELSGGQRQRVGIARALALSPELIVADEPVSSLDASVQAQISNLLLELQESFGLSYLLIAHDLRLVEHVSDRIAVLHRGRIVETGATAEIFESPRHPHTRELVSAIPRSVAL